MQKTARRILSYLLAVLMVLGCFQGTSFRAMAAGTEDIVKTFAELEKAPYYVYGCEDQVDADGVLNVTYSQQWGQIAYLLPASIDVTKLQKITVQVAGDNTGSLCFKLLDASYENIGSVTAYGNNTVTLDEDARQKAVYFAINNMSAEDAEGNPFSARISSVTFTVEKEEEQGQQNANYSAAFSTIRKTYSLGKLTEAKKYGVTITTDEETGASTLSYTGQYQEVDYYIPEEVDKENLTAIEIKYKRGGGLALKNFTAEGFANSSNTDVEYGNSTLAVSAGKDARTVFGLMNLETSAYECVAESVTFVVNANPTYPLAMLEQVRNDNLTTTVLDGGAMKLSFTKTYQEIAFAIPVGVNASMLSNVKLNITEGDKKELCMKLYNQADWDDPNVYQTVAAYWVDELAVEQEDIVIVALSYTGDASKEITVSGISFTTGTSSVTGVKAEAAAADGIVYTAANTSAQEWGASSTVEGTKYHIVFNGQYDQLYIPLPEAIDLSMCESITFNVEGQTKPVAFKLYDASNSDIDVAYGKTGNFSFYPSSTQTCTAVSLMSTESDNTGNEITLVSVVVKMKSEPDAPKAIQTDVPNLKDALTAKLGADTIVGTAFTQGELKDELLGQLARKHFNAVTLGNELKLDAMLGYSTKGPGQTEKVLLNGEELTVPVLDHSRADAMLNVIKSWNEANPSDTIRVRGHVLVWHSQTEDWFFKENYDVNGDYVSKDVMDKRLEWYIKTMLEYYTGENSQYKGMFYGWDVVNEAINDGTNTYRGASESNWAKVYGDQSNEYIIKAFQFANKYAPANLELYYNDYNDCVPGKVTGITTLLKDVLAAGGTRISAMGMQAHHNMSSPSLSEMESAIRAYCAVVGKVQFTEFDMKASSNYDGSASSKEAEYEKQAYRYKQMGDLLVSLEKEDGIDISGITWWGLIDKNSWLQSSSNVGGAASGNQAQVPLLFDDNYQVKPAFWAFVDATKLNPETKEIVVTAVSESKGAKSYTIGDDVAVFSPYVEDDKVKVTVTVKDSTVDDTDNVTVYVDFANAQSDSAAIVKKSAGRSEAAATSDGYTVTVALDGADALKMTDAIGLDVVVTDGAKAEAFNDFTLSQDTSSKYFAKAVVKPYAVVDKGTAIVDGEKDAIYSSKGTEIPLSVNLGAKASAKATLLWDGTYLYVFAEITDADLNDENADAYQHDSLEVFIDENNHKSEAYEADDKQYRVDYKNVQSFNGTKCTAQNLQSAVKETADGYVIEAAYKWTDITPAAGTEIGLELQINDADNSGKRIGTLSWYDESGMGWSKPSVFGTVVLKDTTPAPAATVTGTAVSTQTPAVQVAVEVKYTVKKGDTLSKIAKTYGVTVSDLLLWNPQIKNPNRIYIGQILVVGTTASDATAEDTQAENTYYVVVRGDNLYKIARKAKTTLSELYKLNPELRRRKYIFAGEKIRIK